MRRLTKSILGLMLFCAISVSYAVKDVRCVPLTMTVQDKNIILPGVDKPRTLQVYFIQNISQQSLWIDHVMPHRSASAGWSSYLHPGKWSAIILNRKNFPLSCAVIKPGKVDYLDCAQAISVCTPQNAVITRRKGAYWLIEDKTWDDMVTALEKRGVHFKS